MEALLAELREEFGESRLFRPYRETRFSADETSFRNETVGMSRTVGRE